MLSRALLLALLGLAAVAVVRAEDAADGEVKEDIREEVIEDGVVGPSPDASLSFIFTQPSDANLNNELIGGKPVKYLVGFQNKGEKDFVVKFSETSFRYHQDFNYHIQNFTAGQYNRRVAPKEEVTIDYAFYAHEQFAGRPLGLVVNIHYEDSDGRYFINTVYNQTVNVLEDEGTFNGETGFLLLVLAGLGVLALLAGQHFLGKLSKKTGVSTKKYSAPVETGTGKNEVDFEWIPRQNVESKKSPKPNSPRPRKAQKAE